MKNLSMGKKLLACLLCIMSVVVMMLIGGFYAIAKGQSRLRGLYDENFTTVKLIGDIREQYQQETSMVNALALNASGSEQYSNYLAGIQKSNEDILAGFEKYKVSDKDKEQEALDGLKAAYKGEYTSFVTKAEELSVKNDTEAVTQLIDANSELCSSILDKFNELESLNDEYASNKINEAKTAMNLIIIVLFAETVLGIFVTFMVFKFLDKNISKRIHNVVEAANEIAEGNINIMVDDNIRDEIGQLTIAFNSMIANVQTQADTALAISEKDFTVKHNPRSRNDKMGNSLVKTIDELNEAFSTIITAVNQVNAGAEQVSDGAQTLSQGAATQASSIEELAATINDISGQVKGNADNAAKARALVIATENEVGNGSRQMDKMMEAMNDINKSSTEISKIIKVIDDIAFQTNILALNAAVEAARAGSAGKGFAVVADEVRNLAAKSAAAAQNTTSLIENSIRKVSEGTKIADSTASSLEEIVKRVNEVADLVNEIDAASEHQANSISQVTLGIEQISSVVQTNSATADGSAAASEELSAQAAMLKELLSKIKLKNSPQSFTRNISHYSDNSFQAEIKPAVNVEDNITPAVAEKPEEIVIDLNDEDFGDY